MKKLILSVVATVAAIGASYAQYTPDALKFSQTNYGSTARFKAMGGAQIGVGGDMSSLGGNPAGLGLFTKSEFSLTPEFNMMKGDATYLNQNTNSSRDRFNLNNIGAVFYSPTYKVKGLDAKKGVVSAVFGVGYNRNNDFSGDFSYSGRNSNNTISDYFAEYANSQTPLTDPSQLPSGALDRMAYDTYLIGYEPGSPTQSPFYYSSARNLSNALVQPVDQTKTELRSGSTSEVNVAGALNISNQVYIGASIGFVSVRYINDSEFRESGYNFDENSNYSLSFRQNQETKGSGVNGRLGVIFRPVSAFRIGATFQTPTWLLIEDNTSIVLDSRIATGVNADLYTNTPVNYPFSYRLRTPLKGSLGASYVIGNKALISADIDYMDYSTIRFSIDQSGDESIINSQNIAVRNNYTEAVNYRFGAEYKVDNAVSLRAGYGSNGSPIKGDKDGYFATNYYSGGIGYRVNNYFFDATYQRMETNTDLAPYELNDFSEPEANIKTARNNVFLTFGIRF